MTKETPHPPERRKKTREELIEEGVQKKLIDMEVEARLEAELAEQEVARQKRRHLVQQRLAAGQREAYKPPIPGVRPMRPFAELIQATAAHVGANEASAANKMSSREYFELEKEMRLETIEGAKIAAEMLRQRNVDPDAAVIIHTGSTTKRHASVTHQVRRKLPLGTRGHVSNDRNPDQDKGVIISGNMRNEPYSRRELFGKKTVDNHRTLTYGWKIPISQRESPGSHAILCEDGTILTVLAHQKPAESLADMHFEDGHQPTNEAFLRKKHPARQSETAPSKSIYVTDFNGYRQLGAETESLIERTDLGIPMLPTNESSRPGAHNMIERREMDIREGIASLLVDHGAQE